MSDIIPLFSTAASLKDGGIFTVEKAGTAAKAGRKFGPVSLCDLAQENKLTQLHLVEDRMGNFMAAEKNLRAVGCSLVFGLKLTVCADMADKSEESFRTESKVIIFMAGEGDADYAALCNIHTAAAQDGFYYVPRIDWKTLKAMWHPQLLLALPFYSSFLAKNTLTFASIVPELPAGVTPILLRETGQCLPFDGLLHEAVDRYVATTGAAVQRVKSIYYPDRARARQFLVWRCILNRTTWDKPNQDGMCSREFCWEAYGELLAKEQVASNKCQELQAA